MINIAIYDEKAFQEKMRKTIVSYMEQKEVEFSIGTFGDERDLLKYCDMCKQQTIVFLAINTNGTDRIATATRIRELSPSIYIVFVTADIRHALEGYKVKAFRCIIKEDENFEQSLEECVNAVLDDMGYGLKRLEFNFREGEKKLSIDSIVYIESNLHTIIFHAYRCNGKHFTMTATLNEIEDRLNKFDFLRIHQSFLVNLTHLKMIRNYVAEMDDGSELPIPHSKYRIVKDAYVKYKSKI